MTHLYDPLTHMCATCGIHARQAVELNQPDCPMDTAALLEIDALKRRQRDRMIRAGEQQQKQRRRARQRRMMPMPKPRDRRRREREPQRSAILMMTHNPLHHDWTPHDTHAETADLHLAVGAHAQRDRLHCAS